MLDVATLIDHTKKRVRASRLQWYRDESLRRMGRLLNLFEELRNDPLEPWKCQYATFDACCEAEFGVSASRIRQLRNAASVRAALALEAPELAPVIQSLNEGQVRELAGAPAEHRAEVLRTAVADGSQSPLTARTIKRAKARVIRETVIYEEPGICGLCGKPI